MSIQVWLSLLIVAIFLYVMNPLIIPVAVGAVLAVLMFPAFEYLRRKRIPGPLNAGMLTAGLTLLVLVPLSFLIYLTIGAAIEQLEALRVWVDLQSQGRSSFGISERILETRIVQIVSHKLTLAFPMGAEDLSTMIKGLIDSAAVQGGNLIRGLLARLPSIFMAAVVAIVSLFFFLYDGRRVVHMFRLNSPYSKEQTEALVSSLGQMCRSVFYATIVSGLVQAHLFVLGCWITDVGNIALIGLLVFFTGAFIPVIGASLVVLPVAGYQLMTGQFWQGMVLLVVGIFVLWIDLIIRAIVMRGSAKLHPLLAFLSAFGGIQVLGAAGLFLGPILAGITVVTTRFVFTLKGP